MASRGPAPRWTQLPNFPGDEPLGEDSGSSSEDMDLAQADTRHVIEKLATSDLCVPSSWSAEGGEDDEEDSAKGAAELVGTLRELAELSRPRMTSVSSEPRCRRTSTFPRLTEKASFLRRIRSEQTFPQESGLPSDCEATAAADYEMPVPNESMTNETVTTGTTASVHDIPHEGDSPKAYPTREAVSERSPFATGPPLIMWGKVWKKRSNLSRSTMVFRLLRREARALLSCGEEWLVGGGSLHLGRVGLLAKEVMALLATPSGPSRALPAPQGVPPQAADHGQEPLWDKTHVCLREGGLLQWVRPLSEKAAQAEAGEASEARREDRSPTADGNQVGQLGPLHGSSVEFLGIQANPKLRLGDDGGHGNPQVLHVFRLFPPHHLRRQPMTFAVETSAELEQWMRALRSATEVVVPPAQPHSRWLRLVDFWEARGPPERCEAPPAKLQLQVLRTSGLVADRLHDSHDLPGPESGEYPCKVGNASNQFSSAGPHNLYVLGQVHGCHFRTATRYGVDCAGVTVFGHQFDLPLWFENPDEMVEFKVYHEPEYDDSEPILLGGIRIPLFTLSRGRMVALQLPLKQDDATRRGFVNVSFGHLTIAARVEQPLGYLCLPVEPPIEGAPGAPFAATASPAPGSTALDWADLEKQISRLVELIQMVFVRWQNSVIFVIQWEHFWYSLLWFLFMELWFLFLWRWSFPIIFALLLKRTLDLRRRLAPAAPATAATLPVEPLPEHWRFERKHRRNSFHPEASCSEPPDLVTWEAERRWMFGGFSADYLIDGAPEAKPNQMTDVILP